MIIVKLQGGFGNQMFQYAFGKSVSKKLDEILALDISSYQEEGTATKREYGLHVFNIEETIATSEDIKKCKLIKETAPGFNHDFMNMGGNTYYDGYWNSYKYFEWIEQDIRNCFSIKKPLGSAAARILQNIKHAPMETVSIQIRRGDYVDNKKFARIYGVLSARYYKQGVLLASKGIKDPKILIFSEKLGWMFKFRMKMPFQIEYVSCPDIMDYEEIYLMSQCQNHVISNSTFGWWGAWLDPNPNKVVICPEKYYKYPRFKNEDLWLPEWIRLK